MYTAGGLLDPVSYPGAIKAFAKEVCRNDLLNFGRLHFFFPDSRLALDLNTDKTLKVLNRLGVHCSCHAIHTFWHSYNRLAVIAYSTAEVD